MQGQRGGPLTAAGRGRPAPRRAASRPPVRPPDSPPGLPGPIAQHGVPRRGAARGPLPVGTSDRPRPGPRAPHSENGKEEARRWGVAEEGDTPSLRLTGLLGR